LSHLNDRPIIIQLSGSNYIDFFIYLRAQLSIQWPITESARKKEQQQDNTGQNKTKQNKNDQLRLFMFTTEFPNISALAAETIYAK
jgi:hypothetical protein